MKNQLIGKFVNVHGEKFEIWIRDNDLMFKGDETDCEFMSFNKDDFLFEKEEQKEIITIVTNYLNLKGFEDFLINLNHENLPDKK